MANEAWLNGRIEGFTLLMMPAAHALTQAIIDLEKYAANLTDDQLIKNLNDSPSIAFHLRHIAGSVDRLLTYARNEELSQAQYDFLKSENEGISGSSATELTENAVAKIRDALATLKNTLPDSLFEERFVGRRKLPTNVFGLLFHIAEHTARHVGQIVTLAKIVHTSKTN